MKMTEVRKKFDRTLYEVADTKAKNVMIDWLKNQDHVNINSNETTYFDIVSTVDEGLPRHLYEVEIKYSWRSNHWPTDWHEIRIPHRKLRLLNKWKDECPEDLLTFIVFNYDCTRAWHIDGDTVLNSEVKEASNRNIRKGEKFFHIKYSDAYCVDMTYESNS
jgi:hypothetical protein